MCRSMVDIQSPTAEIRRGKKERRKKQDENIYGLPITWGDHKQEGQHPLTGQCQPGFHLLNDRRTCARMYACLWPPYVIG